MMRSMYSGVSGLRVHQIKMDVIGNNIANVNTIGYKKGQVSFQEAFSQVVKGAGAAYGGKGGTNPQQIGLGLRLGSINTVHTKGATQRTDNPTDLMIDGEGFFVVSDDPKAENRYYTRAGNFTFDLDGNLVTPDGYKLLGSFIGDENYAKFLGIDSAKSMDAIKINRSIPAPASASTSIEIRGNLDSSLDDDLETPTKDESIYETDAIIKDSLGTSYKVELKFDHDIDDDSWEVSVNVKNIETNEEISGIKMIDEDGNTMTGLPLLKFFGNGNLDFSNSDDNLKLDFSSATINGKAMTSYFGSDEDKHKINLDFSKLTQFASDSDAEGFDIEDQNGQIGRSSGSLTGFAIDSSGKLVASFSNGVKKALWQLELAKFDNPMGLVKVGNNFFVKSPNSGEAQIGEPGKSGLGAISPGTLEMSNVDLSMEFTEMIATQRGFQANSRIITTTDEMLQELANMKR